MIRSATGELLDEAKSRLGLTSDYKLGKALNWGQSAVSNLRRGANCMSLIAAADFAEKTGISLEKVVNAARADKGFEPAIRRTA